MTYNYKYVPRSGTDLTDEEFNEIAKMISEILVFLRKKHGNLNLALVHVCATAYGTISPTSISEITGISKSGVRNLLAQIDSRARKSAEVVPKQYRAG